MNKKQILLGVALLAGIAGFSQKDEIKLADKAIKKGDYASALEALSKAEGSIESADLKSQAKYYYLKGISLQQTAKSEAEENEMAESFNKLFEVENKAGKYVYSEKAEPVINELINEISTAASDAYTMGNQTHDDAKLTEAAKGFERVYLLLPNDTISLYNAAYVNGIAKNYEKSNMQYQKLLDMGYTGIATTYTATEVASGQTVTFSSKEEMDNSMKFKGLYENPKEETSESKYIDIVKGMAFNYVDLKENEKALELFTIARQKYPEDYGLLIAQGQTYYKLGDIENFKKSLEEAIKLNPTNPDLYYNVGVMNMELDDNEAAANSFKKAIELKPDYAEAYNNLGAIVLDKTKAVEDKLNANATNFAKYDKIKAEELLPIYEEALPLFEKAYQYKPSEEVKNLLNSLYENLEMDKRI